MPMLLIEGEYRIEKAQPDGDSIRFYPDNKELWNELDGNPIRMNKSGGAQLRLDGIDALETHFNPEGPHLGVIHQPKDLGDKASAVLLELLGFEKVSRDGKQTVTSATPKATRGHIFTRFSDAYGRCVAFAFAGRHPEKSGAQVYVDVADIKKSVNHRLLQQGLAYPTFYSKLFVSLRKEMAAASRAAREAKKGVWSKDRTSQGFSLHAESDLFDEAYVMPKLWRRLTSYIEFNDGDISLGGFKEWLATDDDRVVILPEGQNTGFDTAVEVNGQTVRVIEPLEQLVFQEK